MDAIVQEEPRHRLISGLVLDREFSVRRELDSSHVRQLVEALRAGVELPPIVVESSSARVVDGLHRVEAYRDVLGREALIKVLEKDYEDEAELFLDSVRLNSTHGRKLTRYEQARCVATAQRLSVDRSRIARALSVRPNAVDELAARRFGQELNTQGPVVLKQTILHMRGRNLTQEQLEANNKLGGHKQSFYVNQLILLLENDLLDEEDHSLMKKLGHLKELLEEIEVSVRER